MKKMYRWENNLNQRYYTAHAHRDLLGDLVVTLCWGKRNTKLGRLKSVFCEDEIKAKNYLEKIDKIRCRHGYVRIKNEVLRHDFSTSSD
jgi:predicted DNA-binding WGR domain protein